MLLKRLIWLETTVTTEKEKEDFHIDSEVRCEGAHLHFGAKLAYTTYAGPTADILAL